jgi:riboflavin biosynthesis pyrimidine reductase
MNSSETATGAAAPPLGAAGMRRLLPGLVRDLVDLDAAYWVEHPGHQHVSGAMVASADGAAQADGRAGGLSGPADMWLFATLRGHADVLLVGASTVRAEQYGGDQPSPERRAWRTEHGMAEAPRIAVVTRSCALDPTGPLFTDTLVRPLVVTCHAAPPERTATLADVADVVTAGDESVDVAAALDVLAERGLRRVSCEGGPTLLAQVAAAGRLDELSLTVSPMLLAGASQRILDGPLLHVPARLQLTQVLEDDGFLFLRYLLDNRPDQAATPAPLVGSQAPPIMAAP